MNNKSLNALAQVIKHVYIPLEQKSPDMKQTLSKFVSQITHSSQQVNGTVNLIMPDHIEEIDDDQANQDKELMNQYEEYMESWSKTIKDILESEKAKKIEPNSSLGEIEYWRSRNAMLSTLHQQLNNDFVTLVRRRLEKYL